MTYQPKHARTQYNALAEKYPTDAARANVCLGTHCAGRLRVHWHRHSYNPVHLSPVTGLKPLTERRPTESQIRQARSEKWIQTGVLDR